MLNSIICFRGSTLSIHNHKCTLLPRIPTSQHPFNNPSKPPLLITSTTPPMSLIRPLTISPHSDPLFVIDSPNETHHDESLEELMERVERVKEMMKAREYVDKFLSKYGVGEEVMRGHVEVMAGDVVEKFWEKPIEYLRSGGGRLEDRVKDLRRIVEIFEQTCLDHGKEARSKRGKQCPFLQSFGEHN